MTILFYTITSLLVTLAIILILLVLIQKGRGGGLASAFGGVGGHTAFGSKTGDVLTWATAIVFGVFLTLAVVANIVFNQIGGTKKPAIAATSTTQPAVPGSPNSSLPSAPITADPGVSNPPTAPPGNSPAAPAPSPSVTPSPSTQP